MSRFVNFRDEDEEESAIVKSIYEILPKNEFPRLRLLFGLNADFSVLGKRKINLLIRICSGKVLIFNNSFSHRL